MHAVCGHINQTDIFSSIYGTPVVIGSDVRMSGLQCFNMGHNGHGINLYGVSMTLMEN